jgi:hypothetical protein
MRNWSTRRSTSFATATAFSPALFVTGTQMADTPADARLLGVKATSTRPPPLRRKRRNKPSSTRRGPRRNNEACGRPSCISLPRCLQSTGGRGPRPTSLIIAPWTRARDDEGRARLKSVDRLAGLFVVNDSFAIPVGLAARGAVGRLGTGQAAPFRSNATGQESVSPTRVGAGGSRTEEEA